MKKIISFLLAIAMLVTMIPTIATADSEMSISVGKVTANAGDTVTVPVNVTGNTGIYMAYLAFEYDTKALTLTSCIDKTGVGTAELKTASGYEVQWEMNSKENYTSDGTLFELTFVVSEDAESLSYEVAVSLAGGNDPENLINAPNYNEVSATFTAGTITVTEPEQGGDSGDGGEGGSTTTSGYELYYTLNRSEGAGDGYADYDMPNGAVEATVHLKNNSGKDTVLQAFDLYLTHNTKLTAPTFVGSMFADKGQDADGATHIQFVADKGKESAFASGADLELGTITYTIASNVQYDEDLSITLSDTSNISVGANRNANEAETGAEVGDIVSYKPTITTTVQGAEVKTYYTVTYDLDGGEGTDTEQTKEYNKPLTLHGMPTKTGHNFTGWKNTDGTTYDAGYSYTVNAALTLTAQWEEATYEVTIVNGNGTSKQNVAYNGTFTVPAADAKEGHTFTKWVDADGTEYTVGQEITITKALTLTAQYEANSYTITWVVDGVTTTETYKYGDTPSFTGSTDKAADAQYTYTFSGWSPQISAVTGDATYTAQYSTAVNSYTITWVVDGKPTIETYDYGEIPSFKGSTDKAADAEFTYTFAGWDPEIETVTGDKTYTATYTETRNKYTVTVNDNDGTTTTEVEYGTQFTVPTAAAKEGWSFVNWTDGNGNVVSDATITITGPITLTANYTINSYKITWNVDGTETVETYQYGATVTAKANPSKDGYTFLHWADKDGNKLDVVTNMPATDLTYTASWKEHTYNVKFDANGGTIAEGSEIAAMENVDYTTSIEMPNATGWTKDGWVFVGWSQNKYDYNPQYTAGTSYSGLTKEDGKDVTLYAIWKQNVYNIQNSHVDVNGNAIAPEVTKGLYTTYSSNAGLKIGAPVAVGYTFKGWTSTTLDISDKVQSIEITAGTTGDIELTAHWEIKKITITFDTDGGNKMDPITQDYNTEVAEPEKPTKEGYTFDKWVDDKGQEVTFPMDMPAENVTIKATWTINSYAVTWNVDGAKTEETYEYNAAINKPADPEKEGYTFAGWTPAVPEKMPASNQTFTATWTVNSYTVTWVVDEAETEVNYEYGAAVTEIAAPTKTGYTFTGWDTEIPATMPAENVTIKATWQINQYTITFDTDGGNAIDAITKDYNSEVTAPAAPTKTGYTFTGWDTEIPATMPARDMTIKAKWTINQYTITFADTGDTAIEPITQDYATAVTAPAAPTKTGHTFAGWDKEIPATMPAEDMTITAKWTVNQYTITFDSDGGSTVAPITQNFGTTITKPTDPTKTGYTFKGWNPEVPAIMPAENLTVKAQWEKKDYTITFVVPDGKEIASMTYTFESIDTLPIAENNNSTMYSFDKWVVSYATDATEKGWGDAGSKVDAGSAVTNRYGNVTLTATWKAAASLVVEQYKYADNNQFLLRVKDNLGGSDVYQFDGAPMYHTSDPNYLVNTGDSGVFYILISGDKLDKDSDGKYVIDDNGCLKLTDEAYKLLQPAEGNRQKLVGEGVVNGDINGDTVVNIADANIVYQMTQYTGNYYTGALEDAQRLMADMDPSLNISNNDRRASIEDVHAVVDIINSANG